MKPLYGDAKDIQARAERAEELARHAHAMEDKQEPTVEDVATRTALFDALVVAKQEIKALHDRLFPHGWVIYETHSLEMRQINAALAALAEKES